MNGQWKVVSASLMVCLIDRSEKIVLRHMRRINEKYVAGKG